MSCQRDNLKKGSTSQEESNAWDKDCKTIKTPISKLTGYHPKVPWTDEQFLEPKLKRLKNEPEINSNLLTNRFIDNFNAQWASNSYVSEDGYELITAPFKLCIFKNFLDNPDVLNNVRQEMYDLDWNSRNMDLYEFYQSKDLRYLTSSHLLSIYNFLKDNVMQWVGHLMGFTFDNISATCSLYGNTDYLLVHDDQRDDRLVAFVLYLTEPLGWNENDGGALELLDKEENGHPRNVVRKIYPTNNQLVIFPVSNHSYHKVGEVKTMDKCRISINGWFHSKNVPVFENPTFVPRPGSLFSSDCIRAKEVDIDLEFWVNDEYLNLSSIKEIQQCIEDNSEISLKDFFNQECFYEISQVLVNATDINWIKVGPPNRFSYEVLDLTKFPHSLERFLDLFQSTKMFSLLHQYTDLELLSATSSMKFELQKWTPGCYSLLTEYDWQSKKELDLIMYFGCSDSSDIIGARTQYVTLEDEIQNALITIDPVENNLNIVYRDIARFTKYYSEQSKCKTFYCLLCSYSE